MGVLSQTLPWDIQASRATNGAPRPEISLVKTRACKKWGPYPKVWPQNPGSFVKGSNSILIMWLSNAKFSIKRIRLLELLKAYPSLSFPL